MNNTYMIYPLKFYISLGTSLVSLALSFSMLFISRPGSFLLFFAIAVVFLGIALINGSRIQIDESGISHIIFHKIRKHYAWDSIAEIGVVGSKVFGNDDKKNVGSRYLYFSQERMSEEERFQMVLRWPPRDKLYMLYNPDRLASVQAYWNGSITTYKAGDVFF